VEKYDPMIDFWKTGINYLFKQGVAVVICTVACFVLWNEMNRRDNVHESKISLLNTQWSGALNDARADWRMCEEKRRELEIQFTELKARVDVLSRRR